MQIISNTQFISPETDKQIFTEKFRFDSYGKRNLIVALAILYICISIRDKEDTIRSELLFYVDRKFDYEMRLY